jgi:D-alanine-D-alanine ligase
MARAVKPLRIAVVMHPDFIPPDDAAGFSDIEVNKWKTEYDVVTALTEIGHSVRKLGVSDEFRPIRQAVGEFKAHIVFNLLEEFKGEVIYDQNVVSYLQAIGVRYTGCDPEGLVLGRGKALSKKIVSYHRVRVPHFGVFLKGHRVKRSHRLAFPLIVKSLSADASLGISQASIVNDDEKLIERVQFIHDSIGTDAIVEQYIDGRDVYVAVLGNKRLQVFEPQELVFDSKQPNPPRIATEKVKHDVAYQKKWGVDVRTASLPPETKRRLFQTTKRIYRALSLSGYARIDYRLDSQERLYFLEANPNPDLARYEEFANAAEVSGVSYELLLQRIVSLGMQRPRI